MINGFNKEKNTKKSQIFFIDFMFATILIIVSLGTFLIYYSLSDPQEDLFDTVYRLSNVMSSTQINDLNNDFVRDLFISREITNIDNTILQQISDFYERGELDGNFSLAQNLTQKTVETYFIDRVGYEITIDDIESSSPELILDSSENFLYKNESKTVATVQRQIIGFYNSTPFIHRYKFEVWRN